MSLTEQLKNAIKAIEAEKERHTIEKAKEISELKTEKDEEISEFKKMLEMLEGKVESEQQVLNLTCWKSLAYCCSLERKCLHRDIALEVLGISKEDFAKIKKDTHKAFMEKAKINRIHKEDYKTEKRAREAE